MQGIEQLRPSIGLQVQKPNLQTQNQFLLASQNQQVLQQTQAQGSLGSSPNYALGGLPRGTLNTKDGQQTRSDGPICSPVHSNSQKVNNDENPLVDNYDSIDVCIWACTASFILHLNELKVRVS